VKIAKPSAYICQQSNPDCHGRLRASLCILKSIL
jgi:hypothetical protein